MEWISVKDKMPYNSGYYLTCCNTYRAYKPNLSYYSREDKSFYDAGITHWMPLPEPPKTFTDESK